jgi:hypothetical protein
MTRFVIGAVAGVLLLGGLRFAFAPWDAPTHYHANWAVFIDGERLDLTDERYMEDASACADRRDVQAADRVHMHDGNHDVVHVHHEGATWGHLMSVLGFGLGPDYLITDDGRRLFSEDGRTLKFVINGLQVSEIHNRVIRPGDRLVISYGPETADQVLAEQFPQVASNAPEYDRTYDPAGCSGPQRLPLLERLRAAFWG